MNPSGRIEVISIAMKTEYRTVTTVEEILEYIGDSQEVAYDGLKGCTDYKKAVQIIKDGGYATSHTYVEKLCSIIERWNLTHYDVAGEVSDVVRYYRVRKKLGGCCFSAWGIYGVGECKGYGGQASGL